MLSSAINNKESETWKVSVKIHSEKYSTWYMKTIWKIQYKFSDLRNGTARPHLHITALLTFHIVKDSIYFLPYRFSNIILISVINPHDLHSRLVREELREIFFFLGGGGNFDLVLLNQTN